jgi:MoxR-like ATPase
MKVQILESGEILTFSGGPKEAANHFNLSNGLLGLASLSSQGVIKILPNDHQVEPEPVKAQSIKPIEQDHKPTPKEEKNIIPLVEVVEPETKEPEIIDPEKLILKAFQQIKNSGSIDIEQVRAIVKEELLKQANPVIEHKFQIQSLPEYKTTEVHSCIDTLVKLAMNKRHAWVYGPPGSGKSYACKQVAEILNIPFYSKSFSSQASVFELKGFQNANGVYVETDFVKCFRDGGLFLLDEIDGANPNVLLSLNSALSNGFIDTPGGQIVKSPEFVCFAGANTIGTGNSAKYAGRQIIDQTTISRFRFVYFGYDENLETVLVGSAIAKKVQKIRQKANEKGLQFEVSPRVSLQIRDAIQDGFTLFEAWDQALINKLNETDKKQVEIWISEL